MIGHLRVLVGSSSSSAGADQQFHNRCHDIISDRRVTPQMAPVTSGDGKESETILKEESAALPEVVLESELRVDPSPYVQPERAGAAGTSTTVATEGQHSTPMAWNVGVQRRPFELDDEEDDKRANAASGGEAQGTGRDCFFTFPIAQEGVRYFYCWHLHSHSVFSLVLFISL